MAPFKVEMKTLCAGCGSVGDNVASVSSEHPWQGPAGFVIVAWVRRVFHLPYSRPGRHGREAKVSSLTVLDSSSEAVDSYSSHQSKLLQQGLGRVDKTLAIELTTLVLAQIGGFQKGGGNVACFQLNFCKMVAPITKAPSSTLSPPPLR